MIFAQCCPSQLFPRLAFMQGDCLGRSNSDSDDTLIHVNKRLCVSAFYFCDMETLITFNDDIQHDEGELETGRKIADKRPDMDVSFNPSSSLAPNFPSRRLWHSCHPFILRYVSLGLKKSGRLLIVLKSSAPTESHEMKIFLLRTPKSNIPYYVFHLYLRT